MCSIYNSTHTFPLSKEEMEIEKHILEEPHPRKKRKSLIEQISEAIIEENQEEASQEVQTVADAITEDGQSSEIETTNW